MSRKKANRRERRASDRKDRHSCKTNRGNEQLAEDEKYNNEDYKLGWFKPNEVQKDLIYSICTNDLTICQGGSGCGKSTTAIHQALTELKRGLYKHLVFIKTPSELGSDQIGYLTGDANQKLAVHFESMRSIFTTFMTKNKLEMEEKRGKIKFTIPNFEAGRTFYNSIIIIDEAQMIDLETLKLLVERLADSSKVIILGDKGQRYSAKKRGDGLSAFVDLITDEDDEGLYSKEDLMGYVEMKAEHNMRGRLSKRIGQIFEEL